MRKYVLNFSQLNENLEIVKKLNSSVLIAAALYSTGNNTKKLLFINAAMIIASIALMLYPNLTLQSKL
ncbi:MAG: hypothetical protein KKC11_02740 [Candidatus Omnitrophica bacterium]|nr:hypothetical protein [Candidatus Omnitrophota bacterium]MBU0878761.1 hypothetical protein [Candidatus Omnitrophota bacterium]MBU1134445.1 hypothetical protein [Candidatus Omnitrophota bacterium]MBU1367382.1 hypothetical protein [Candidatus Omnitrophota bacterium]MBU1524228.1 hypothetical protein [Candidatus Omnitrophota bacterium]